MKIWHLQALWDSDEAIVVNGLEDTAEVKIRGITA